ncbi:hypothetical protein D3C71_492200 [compost metagenome]
MREQRAGGIELLPAEDKTIAVGGDTRLEFQGVFGAAFRPGITDAPAVEHAFEQLFFLRFSGAAQHQIEDAELVLRDLSKGRVCRGNDREHFGQGDERNLWASVFARDANATQAAAGELFDFRPRQLALLVAFGRLQAGGLRQLMGGLDRLSVVAQDLCGQQQRGDIQITLDDCICQTGHQCRSLAARNALAICTGVIVFRTIPTSHLMETPLCATNENKNVRWSGAYTLSVYK